MRSALSWQQAAGLRDDLAGSEREPNLMALFALPDDVTAEQLRGRLADLVGREDSLRVTELCATGGELTYAPDIELPMRLERAGAQEMQAIGDQMQHHSFARHGGPWWDMALIEHPDELGKPARSVYACFDHLISDGRSLLAFRDELTNAGHAVRRQRGSFLDWVSWQLRQYPMDAPGSKTAASEFWRGYLDGTHPKRGTALPFYLGQARPASDVVRTIYGEVPTSLALLRSAAGRLNSSPFLLVLASVAAAISLVADVNDVTLRVNTSGRPPAFLDTIGLFSDSLPIRIARESLSDPRVAVSAATAAWLQALRFQTTPWDYIVAVCAPEQSQPAARLPPQVLVNFVPWPVHSRWYSQRAPREERGGWLETFQLILLTGADGTCHLNCIFDPELFAAADVPGFLAVLADVLARVIALG